MYYTLQYSNSKKIVSTKIQFNASIRSFNIKNLWQNITGVLTFGRCNSTIILEVNLYRFFY